MSDALPPGWIAAPIATVATFNPKHDRELDRNLQVSFVPMPRVNEYSGTIESHHSRPLSSVWTGYTHFADGDVIFAKITPCMENGKAAIARGLMNGLACGSTEFHVMRPSAAVLPEYLWHFIRQQSFRDDAEQVMSGAVGQRRVPLSYLEAYPIPLAPLPEQRRIVARIETLFARTRRARAELERVVELTKHFKRQSLSAVFAEAATISNLVQLGSTMSAIEAGKNIRCDERRPAAGERGIVKISAVTWGRFDASQIKTAPKNAELDRRSRIEDGDFLLSRANTLELVGAPVIAAGVPPETYLSDKVLRLRFREPIEEWVMWYLRSPQGREEIESRSSGNQLSMRNIGQGGLREIPIPLPNADTRRPYVKKIKQSDAAASLAAHEATRALALLYQLEQAILSKAFRGELVPQDPANEPVAVLLARQAQAGTPTHRRRAASVSA